MVLHADGNSFYASCEQIYRPDLRGKPVAVLSNNDGIIIALNKEAKACGIKRGDPYFKVRDICEWKGITICIGAAPTHLLHAGYSKCRPACPTLYLPPGLRLQSCEDYAA